MKTEADKNIPIKTGTNKDMPMNNWTCKAIIYNI
jgi:hypothetical protein